MATRARRRKAGRTHEVSSLLAFKAIEVYLPRVYLARYVPLSGFLNLLAVYSFECPGVLFHTPDTFRVRLPEFFPHQQYCNLVDHNDPHGIRTAFRASTHC
jgi:hypothetical protein